MDEKKFLEPDSRWILWECHSHKEYLDRFFIKGKFHPDVPEAVRSSYEIVERLIAYSYFHYPMIEEVISKMTRIFEMAVKIKAKSLGINCNKGLSDCLNKLKSHEEIEPTMSKMWFGLKEIRNYYAHPESHSFSGPTPLIMLYPTINTINSLFCPGDFFLESENRLIELQRTLHFFNDGIFIYEANDVKRLIISARPYFLEAKSGRSLWIMVPVYINFPNKMEAFDYLQNPMIMRLSDITLKDGTLSAMDYTNGIIIKLYPTEIEGNVLAAKKYKHSFDSADEDVKLLHNSNSEQIEFHEKQKFIYDEFWN